MASALLLSLATLVLPTAANICSTLADKGIPIEVQSSPQYSKSLKYWSLACQELKPACIAAPENAEQVASIIESLQQVNDSFAIKSGGHSPVLGFSSIQDGLLISMEMFKDVTYHDDDQTAVIGAGLSWQDAHLHLNQPSQMIVGGRVGGVGVSGLILGGGLSFLSPQYGWAANSVVNYEIVLADGTIVNANATSYEDLYFSLKGAGNNYGIVTAFTVQTYPAKDGEVWGGGIFIKPNQTRQILEAVRSFVEYYPDNRASILPTFTNNEWLLLVFYDGSTPPDNIFQNFTSIPTANASTTQTWDSYYDLIHSNDQYNIMGASRYASGAEVLPLPNQTIGGQVLEEILDFWNQTTEKARGSCPGTHGSIALHPIPRTMTQAARDKGGDLINFPTDHDYLIVGVLLSYVDASCTEIMDRAIEDTYKGINDIIIGYIKQGKLPDVPRPLYLNDINSRQDYWGRVDTKPKAIEAKEKYDPYGFFTSRTSGGFGLV
ncbi:FAD dependent oxidoreductase [Aspergillus novoparasiticus]|uniref:FAD dependent oxidoreductase n=1 Tax=Aspergillus novoparasiticus TaxID=986946 RepID=A0A5N6E8H7_9EURO|nr:FAD dependent oxidoreductase [Aspergillus novoparasiticus]